MLYYIAVISFSPCTHKVELGVHCLTQGCVDMQTVGARDQIIVLLTNGQHTPVPELEPLCIMASSDVKSTKEKS